MPQTNPPIEDVPVHPVQCNYRGHSGTAPQTVTMRAYEVYKEVHGEQEALITGGCRGGFGTGKLIAFLYARSFPRNEWAERAREAFRGMKL